MADPGPSQRPTDKGDRKRKLSSNEENKNKSSPMSKTMIKDEHLEAAQLHRNMAGIKSFLHGISYQIKLCIYVSLANAKIAMNPSDNADKFSFTVSAEDPAAGKFDDIVYSFKHGERTGKLNIQAKHKSGSPASKITLDDFTTNSDTKNPFAVSKYFISFCDHQHSTTDLEGFIICTNAAIDDKAIGMWKTVEPKVKDDSEPSLDFYVSVLFERIGGNCFRLDYDELRRSTDGMFSHLYQLLRQCTKRARLAALLIEAIKSKKKITRNNPLCKQYRQAILDVVDRNLVSTNGSYGFTSKFLGSYPSNLQPNFESFRKEFEDQYRQEFKINGSVWDDVKLKRIHVAKDFMSEKNDESSDSFPDENVDQMMKSFCERFRLWCDTNNENELDETIVDVWKNFKSDDEQLTSSNLQNRCIEESVATKMLFKTNFDWLTDPFAKPLHSEDILKGIEMIKYILAQMKLNGISEKLREKVARAKLRISHDSLERSVLFDEILTENHVEVEAFDIQFGASVVSDILSLQCNDLDCILYLDQTDIVNDSDTVEAVLRCFEQRIHLIIICYETLNAIQSIIRKWKKDILKHTANQLILIKKTNNSSSFLNDFRIRDLTKESCTQFHSENIPICTTTIAAGKIFQSSFHDISIEEITKVLEWGKQMGENNELMKKYQDIESTYVNRGWIADELNLKPENLVNYAKLFKIFEHIIQSEKENIGFKDIIERIKGQQAFNKLYTKRNNPESNHESNVDDAKKVLIFLGEAGCGKSTNLTWLAWHLWERYPSSWVYRCNLSAHCTAYVSYRQDDPNNDVDTVIDEIEALRMLYKLIHLSLQLEQINAQKSAECLTLSDGNAIMSEDLMKFHGLSLENSIALLVFREKFNSGELMLLFDGFDEIAPHYKQVVLKFLCLFEQFKGVRKLYLTSRPYGFKEQFQVSFRDPSFFQLTPLMLQDKVCMLYKSIREKYHNGNDDDEISDFNITLCIALIFLLRGMSDIPLNLVMSVEILEQHVVQYIHIPSKTVSFKLFKETESLLRPSAMVEEFVRIKIQHSLYEKIGAGNSASNNPRERDRYENAIHEAKLQHGLLALWVLFDKSERDAILSANEIREAEDYMNKIHEASEKTGIVNGLQDGVPMFIHRTFAEYLAAWWIVKRRVEDTQGQGLLKISRLNSFWKESEMRRYIDTILAKGHPLNLAIIWADWYTAQKALQDNLFLCLTADNGNRTPLHLFMCYWDFPLAWRKVVSILSKNAATINLFKHGVINQIEKFLGWTALDYAFNRAEPKLIFYLLHLEASINVNALYNKVVSPGNVHVRKSARYAKYFMGYLSRKGIEYESHNDCKAMKQFCDKVAGYLINETPAKFRRTFDPEAKNLNDHEKSIIEDVIVEDSVWLLESIIKQVDDRVSITQMIKESFFEFSLKNESIFALKYFVESDQPMISEEDLLKCILSTVQWNYKHEFKWFFDLYCFRMCINDFHPCSIQNEDVGQFIVDTFNVDALRTVYRCRENIFPSISTEIIDPNILSVLVVCVLEVRLSMLNYLKESCKLNLGADLVYHLAKIIRKLFSTIQMSHIKETAQAYEFLLLQASNISDVEANKMLRLAMMSDLFDFSKCLIERYNIDLKVVDDLTGMNAFHLCVSRPRSVHQHIVNAILELFCCMLNKMAVDCFGIFDQNGRSILHLALENQHNEIAEYIIAQKLGIDKFNEMKNIGVDGIPNLTYCYSEIHHITKSTGKKKCSNKVLGTLADQIAKLSLENHDQLTQQSTYRLLTQDPEELYQIAVKCCSPFLISFLYRTFGYTISSSVHDADWLAWIAKSLKSQDIQIFKWVVNQYCIEHHIILPHGAKDIGYQYEVTDNTNASSMPLNVEELIEQVEMKLSNYLLKDELCIIKLVVLTVCLKHESAVRYLCEMFDVNIDRQILFDIMEIAHYITGCCESEIPVYEPIYEYLFERYSNLRDIDAEGKNIFHFAAYSGPNCLTRFLFNYEVAQTMIINNHNALNVFHYYALRHYGRDCCYTSNVDLFGYILQRVVKSDENEMEDTIESRDNRIKDLCFNSNERSKSVILLAVEAGNFALIECIFNLCLGITNLDLPKVLTLNECSIFKECYDALNRIANALPFNAKSEKLLASLAKPIDSFSLENITNKTNQENVQAHVLEDTCRSAISYRSISTLEHLIISCKHQMNQELAESTSRELFACMLECIRRNRTSLFKVLVGHYRTSQGIQPRVEVEYDEQENDYNNGGARIDERDIQWSVVDEIMPYASVNPNLAPLLILLVTYERLSMAQYLIEMLQLVINRPLIRLILKALLNIELRKREGRALVFEYLARISEGKPHLLHLCAQVGHETIVRYLIEDKHQDPNEIDSESGWNAGHYCVSEPVQDSNREHAFEVLKSLIEMTHMDCLGLFDRKGRSVLHLAMENGHTQVVEYIVKHKLSLKPYEEVQDSLNLEKIDECINEIARIAQIMPDIMHYEPILLKLIHRKYKLNEARN